MGVDAVGRWAAATVLAAVTWGGCADAEEGCLDYRALRVDLNAETACDDCCDYPGVTLQQVVARVDTGGVRLVRTTDSLATAAGDTVLLTALSYFLHDVALELADGTLLPLLDTFSVREDVSRELALAERSLLRVSPLRTPRMQTGTLLQAGEVVAWRARFGLPADLVAADARAQPSTSPLAIPLDTALLTVDPATPARRFRSAVLVRRRLGGTAGGGPDSVVVAGGAAVDLRVALPTPFPLRRSYNLEVALVLPVTALVDLPAGETAAADFASALFGGAYVDAVRESR